MPRLLVSVLVPYYILLSFDFVSYACPGFVIVLVFLVPHMKLVYLAFFILYTYMTANKQDVEQWNPVLKNESERTLY